MSMNLRNDFYFVLTLRAILGDHDCHNSVHTRQIASSIFLLFLSFPIYFDKQPSVIVVLSQEKLIRKKFFHFILVDSIADAHYGTNEFVLHTFFEIAAGQRGCRDAKTTTTTK